jgi:hypothetical protein
MLRASIDAYSAACAQQIDLSTKKNVFPVGGSGLRGAHAR